METSTNTIALSTMIRCGLIDFEKGQFCPDDAESLQNEMANLRGPVDGRDWTKLGFRFVEESCEET